MSNLRDIHIKLEILDIERLKHFCLHRGDISFLINQSVKRFLDKLEEKERASDSARASTSTRASQSQEVRLDDKT